MAMRKILLYGPPLTRHVSGAYGGGTGGYTRNMAAYLSSLHIDGYYLEPLFHTIRGQYKFFFLTPLIRMIIDGWRILDALIFNRPFAVHILAQYRSALPRELFLLAICRVLNVRLIYDIKAGAFIQSLEDKGCVYHWGISILLNNSLVLVEGHKYINFIDRNFAVEALYFPNFVPIEEIPKDISTRLKSDTIKVLFVGYCYAGKGVYELLEGCLKAACWGVKIELTMIGEEEADFARFANSLPHHELLQVIRLGRRPHDDVLRCMERCDVYCYPTSHSGEGHNNSINEAMMYGLVILTTRHGFLLDVLGEKCALYLNTVDAIEVAKKLKLIFVKRVKIRNFGSRAREKLLAEFNSKIASQRLQNYYHHL